MVGTMGDGECQHAAFTCACRSVVASHTHTVPLSAPPPPIPPQTLPTLAVYVADAIVKGIPGFNATLAYEAIRKDAFVVPTSNIGEGRTCLTPYLEKGYVAHNAQGTSGTCSEVLSRSLNYMLADAAIAKAATALGYADDAAILTARAANYSVLFDPATGFMRSRDVATGTFTEPFDQWAWGGDYTEAGPHQYRYYVPHDPKGLAKLYAAAGLDMCAEIEKEQVGPSTFHIGAYGTQIHEQTEMATLCWGQYEHNNQPVHHMVRKRESERARERDW
jgi:putative alpha-1,2-mannosidase